MASRRSTTARMDWTHDTQMIPRIVFAIVLLSAVLDGSGVVPTGEAAFAPGRRVVLDAHNAYPDHGRWRDRIDRALATGVPVAIEQDLAWTCSLPPACRSIVTHGEPFTGEEPSLREYFFERIRPVIERAQLEGNHGDWPLVTLNLDFKTNEPEHHAAVWRLLGEYEGWLTTAARMPSVSDIAPLDVRPVLVLTGSTDEQEVSFHDRVPVGGRLRLFGAVPPATANPQSADAPQAAAPGALRLTNYRRWSNNPWSVVEPGGPREAGEWTADDAARLRTLVASAHDAGLWIRFYTLNGVEPGEPSFGWEPSYDFGSRAAAAVRWRAALEAGVDFVATDQYEAFAALRAEIIHQR
jgi:hypothetical protein